MTIDWIRPTQAELDSGILAKRAITCYCDNGKDERPRLDRIEYFGGFWTELEIEGKKKKVFIERTPAVINYDYGMLLKLWRNHPELMPPFIDVILP